MWKSLVATTWSYPWSVASSAVMSRATADPPVTASEPPSQKSFCTSTTMSARDVCMIPTLPAEQQIKTGERVADHHQHRRELAGQLVLLRQQAQGPVMRRDHPGHVTGEHEADLEGGQQRRVT